jgi:hypothetical protein
MPISFNNTTLTFNDATTQTTAAGPSAYLGLRGIVYTSSGTFTIPAGVTSFKATCVGGGGGGGGANYYAKIGGYGGGAGSVIQYFTGLTPGNTITITRGAGGTGGGGGGPSSGGGGTGGTSSVSSGTQTINTASAAGGNGGAGAYYSCCNPPAANGSAGSASGGFLNYAGSGTTSFIGVTQYGGGGNPGFSNSAPGSTGVGGFVLIEY